MNVIVLMGGFGDEYDVSINSGIACHNAIQKLNLKSSCLKVDLNIYQNLINLKPDICFNALHGKFGEDGTIQGFLNALRIPYTHSGVTSSSISMNKLYTKLVISQMTKDEKALAFMDTPYRLERVCQELLEVQWKKGRSQLIYLAMDINRDNFESFWGNLDQLQSFLHKSPPGKREFVCVID